MDSQSQGHRPFSTFSAGIGIGMGPNTFSAFHYPSRARPQNGFEEVNIHNFSNQIPTEGVQPARITTNQFHHEINIRHNDYNRVQPRSLYKSLLWPTSILIAPITLLAAALLALVFAYEVQTDPDLFQPAGHAGPGTSSYILVNFSATRLVFVASFLSSLAPILTSFVMTLWTLPVAESLRLASLTQNYAQLPTPYQLSLVIGLTLTSYERLWRYLAYVFSPSRSQIPSVLHQAAAMLILTTFLAVAVFGSDAALHFATSTVQFDQISNTLTPNLAYGRGLSETCLKLQRLENFGLPCSFNYLGTDPNVVGELNESFRLQHNSSQISELLIIEEQSLKHGDMVVLAEQGTALQPGIDYKASTIGVSSQCQPITTQCNMRVDAENNYLTYFNCTEEFWGVLGAAPNISSTYTKAFDANVPGLAYKPANNLQYEFFNTSQLNKPYNSIGYDAQGEQTLSPLPDAELINPIYFALAGRIVFGSESAGSQINNDSEVFINRFSNGNGTAVHLYYDFALSCTLTSYDIELTYANGSVQLTEFAPTKNGSILEIFHGAQFYVSTGSGDTDLQDYLDQVALQNTTEALAKNWGNLYSQKILSTIGGYTTSRTNLAQQQRTSLLVASVPKAALGALIACSLAYTVLGLTLCIAAYRASAAGAGDVAAELSLAGIVSSAYGEKVISPSSAGTEMSSSTLNHQFGRQNLVGAEVGVGNQKCGFRPWV